MKILKVLLTVSAIQAGVVQATGIPVVDVANLAQATIQVTQMINQLHALQQQISNTTGSRGLANVINSGYDTQVQTSVDTVLSQNGLKNASQLGISNNDTASLYNSSNSISATYLAESQKSLTQAKERFDDLSTLAAKVNSSPDEKDVLDLQARIQAEETLLQNELAKLTALKSKSEAEQVVQTQKIRQMRVQSAGNW
jgi:type IV secretion system protein VirB5